MSPARSLLRKGGWKDGLLMDVVVLDREGRANYADRTPT